MHRANVNVLRTAGMLIFTIRFAGWDFLFTTDTPSAEYYKERLEHEMQQQISESAKR